MLFRGKQGKGQEIQIRECKDAPRPDNQGKGARKHRQTRAGGCAVQLDFSPARPARRNTTDVHRQAEAHDGQLRQAEYVEYQ